MGVRTVGIAGTAKNTGKTTTLSALMACIRQDASIALGLTSIGYDGENLDNVTGLPKPRIDVYPGMLAAVSERCLPFSRAKLELLERTDVMTALGRVLIGRVIRPGKLVVAGPGKGAELRVILDKLASYGASLIIADGALGRIAPFTEVDGIVLATGASRYADIDRLAAENRRMLALFTMEQAAPAGRVLAVGSILGEAAYREMAAQAAQCDTIQITGVLGGAFLADMARNAAAYRGKRILFQDPFKLLLSGGISETHEHVHRLADAGAAVGVVRPARMFAVTVNPYYPRYRITSRDYEPAYVDKHALLAAIAASTTVPCCNVVEQGAGSILSRILAD